MIGEIVALAQEIGLPSLDGGLRRLHARHDRYERLLDVDWHEAGSTALRLLLGVGQREPAHQSGSDGQHHPMEFGLGQGHRSALSKDFCSTDSMCNAEEAAQVMGIVEDAPRRSGGAERRGDRFTLGAGGKTMNRKRSTFSFPSFASSALQRFQRRSCEEYRWT